MLVLYFTQFSPGYCEQPLIDLEQARPARKHKIEINESDFRGWGHLANKLHQQGVSLQELKSIYGGNKLPRFERVSFSLNPSESKNIYRGFATRQNINAANNFLNKYHNTFERAHRDSNVPKEVVAAILLVESHFGKNTGSKAIIYRLSRLANIASPKNLDYNYHRLKEDDPNVTFDQVASRGRYLEDTFLPEIVALVRIAEEQNINIFNVKGSKAGAFGWPQFLPSSYLNHAVDFNMDGRVSLFQPQDAIGSVSNYLRNHGWGQKSPEDVIWKYNKSQAYIDTVLLIAKKLETA